MTTDKVTAGSVDKPPQIDGFEIISLAGSGGMSVVYKARQTAFDRFVAVKMLHRHLITDATTLQRFVNEGRVTTTLHHPNVATVFSCGSTAEEQPYLVLEFIEGQSLKEMIRETHGLPADRVRDLFTQILSGLKAAHDAGIIHRDLKPGNVMMVPGENGDTIPKIVDFGVAKFDLTARGEIQRLTRTGAVVGSPTYMSPEQCLAGQVDVRSDIYSFGCMMFEALTAKYPFEADSALEVMTQHVHQEPSAPSAVTTNAIPADMDTIVIKCLQKDPGKRFQNCDELIQSFQDMTLSQLGHAMPAPTLKALANRRSPLKVMLAFGIVAAMMAVVGFGGYFLNLSHCDQCVKGAYAAIAQRDYDHATDLLGSIQLSFLPSGKQAEVALADYALTQSLDEESPHQFILRGASPYIDKYHRAMALLKSHGHSCPDAKYLYNISEIVDGAANSYETNTLSKIATGRAARNLLERFLRELDNELHPPVNSAFIRAIILRQRGLDTQGEGNYDQADKYYAAALDEARASGFPEHELEILMAQGFFFGAVEKPHLLRKNVVRGLTLAPAVAARGNYEALQALIALMEGAVLQNQPEAYNSARDKLKELSNTYQMPPSMSQYVQTLEKQWRQGHEDKK